MSLRPVAALLLAWACSGCNTVHKSSGAAVLDAEDAPGPAYAPTAVTLAVDTDAYRPEASKPPSMSEALGLADGALPSAASRYYVTVYGYQGDEALNLPRLSHSWALFVRVGGADFATAPLETFVISWDAADGNISLNMPVVPGHQYTLPETFTLAKKLGTKVRRSTLTEISKNLYARAAARYQRLAAGEKNGTVRYRMIDDPAGRAHVLQGSPGYTNCIHALTDVVNDGNALIDTGAKRGYEASDAIFHLFTQSPWGVNGASGEGNLTARLGL